MNPDMMRLCDAVRLALPDPRDERGTPLVSARERTQDVEAISHSALKAITDLDRQAMTAIARRLDNESAADRLTRIDVEKVVSAIRKHMLADNAVA